MLTHTLGFPRMGLNRELKKALESYWKGAITADALREVGAEMRQRHWSLQQAAGIDLVPVGDFSYYDHMLDMTAMLGAVPPRYKWKDSTVDFETYFRMARGDRGSGGTTAMEMTKWFDTNYHYLVPELRAKMKFALSTTRLFDEIAEAKALGVTPKAVIVGPLTWLALGKETEKFDRWSLLDPLLEVYAELVSKLAAEVDWIQIDEPILSLDLPMELAERFVPVYDRIREAAGTTNLILATYFGGVEHQVELLDTLPIDVLHIDLVRAPAQLAVFRATLPPSMKISLGLVNGRNIWRTEMDPALEAIKKAVDSNGAERILLCTSCSLLHVPIDLEPEEALDPEVKAWMAFAKQKCEELRTLADAADGKDVSEALAENRAAWAARRSSSHTTNTAVRARVKSVTPDMTHRSAAFLGRKEKQAEALGLPLLPTTTIGSFPQTPDIRRTRLAYRKGTIGEAEYTEAMQAEIKDVVAKQEALDLDVLVHGEPERNDMVEYFGEQLAGFCFTRNGWVQSYGSRCVKPPVLFGDVHRRGPMTVAWSTYAQSLTKRPMKGMLTGPVTILEWSFVRDDQSEKMTCNQIAFAIRDEVADLEAAGIRVIQIDEPALREGLPLRRRDWERYLEWAVGAFRLCASGAAPETQIHTHMCYAEFNDIIEWIAHMDADVISAEASRSKMDLLNAFRKFDYPNDIGPGLYDIHSPRVPEVKEMVALIRRALRVVPLAQLWINPDCGLKTRDWPETEAALRNMVAAAKAVRAEQ